MKLALFPRWLVNKNRLIDVLMELKLSVGPVKVHGSKRRTCVFVTSCSASYAKRLLSPILVEEITNKRGSQSARATIVNAPENLQLQRVSRQIYGMPITL